MGNDVTPDKVASGKRGLLNWRRILDVFRPSIEAGKFVAPPSRARYGKPSAKMFAYRKRRKRRNKIAYASRRMNQLRAG